LNFSGIVIHGKKLGRTIGYPTANIELAPGIVEDGVYALGIEFDGMTYTGV
jgi:riboflavin kinase / FMN adenylyltransferase